MKLTIGLFMKPGDAKPGYRTPPATEWVHQLDGRYLGPAGRRLPGPAHVLNARPAVVSRPRQADAGDPSMRLLVRACGGTGFRSRTSRIQDITLRA